MVAPFPYLLAIGLVPTGISLLLVVVTRLESSLPADGTPELAVSSEQFDLG